MRSKFPYDAGHAKWTCSREVLGHPAIMRLPSCLLAEARGMLRPHLARSRQRMYALLAKIPRWLMCTLPNSVTASCRRAN